MQKRVFVPVLCGYWFFIRNHQFWFFLNILRIGEPLALDISKTSMTQRFSWMNRQFCRQFVWFLKRNWGAGLHIRTSSFFVVHQIHPFFFRRSLSVCLLCGYFLSVQLLGHYHHGYVIIHMYSFFIACKKVKVKPLKHHKSFDCLCVRIHFFHNEYTQNKICDEPLYCCTFPILPTYGEHVWTT